jgi:hypothetical protein
VTISIVRTKGFGSSSVMTRKEQVPRPMCGPQCLSHDEEVKGHEIHLKLSLFSEVEGVRSCGIPQV